ncbi:Serine/threonine kinase [Xylographa soralifera]|nr:Serine/threonine kinase [Xylographa soralifera]
MQTNDHRPVSSNDRLPETIDNADQKRVGTEKQRANLVAGGEVEGRDTDPNERRWDLDGFNFMAVLGKGNAATVMLAESKATKELYAVKVQKKDLLVENGEVSSIRTEKSILIYTTSKGHPFIAKLYATFQTETWLFFVLEYVSGGDLMFHIQKNRFGPERSKFYAAEICLALKFLHENGILYRDLKLDDILLATDGYIKLVDFGNCEEDFWYGSTTKKFCGNSEFIAPEVLLDRSYGRPIDWWAFGILIYQMSYQRSPFQGKNEDELYEAILHDEPTHPVHAPKADLDIMQKLLTRDPELRLGSGPLDSQEVMNHEYFKDINWDDLYHKRVAAPFIPVIKSKEDISNIDPDITSITPSMTPVDSVLSRAMQEEFRGFSYVAEEAPVTTVALLS